MDITNSNRPERVTQLAEHWAGIVKVVVLIAIYFILCGMEE